MSQRWTDWRRAKEEPIWAGTLHKKPIPKPLVVEDLLAEISSDTEAPNGSSIAFVAEWRGKRILFAGDAHPDALIEAIQPLAQFEGGRYRIDLLKVSHHGSKKNISKDFLDLIDCKKFALSTNGKLHGHPDPEAIAKILSFSTVGMKSLFFNYRSDRTIPWGDAELMSQHEYMCFWPIPEDPGRILIDLSD
jgi:hypothetical protein